MGLPLLAIPESMIQEIETILREDGIEVDSRPIDQRDDPERFLMCLVCTDGKACVALSVQRESHVNPDGPVIVIGPPPRGYQMGKAAELSDRISETLLGHGAWIPTRGTAT